MEKNINLLKQFDEDFDLSYIKSKDEDIELFLDGYEIFKRENIFVFDADIEDVDRFLRIASKDVMNITVIRETKETEYFTVVDFSEKKNINNLLKEGYELIYIVKLNKNPIFKIKHNIPINTNRYRELYLCLCEARRLYMKELNELMEMVGF